jgi:hypothetical protein
MLCGLRPKRTNLMTSAYLRDTAFCIANRDILSFAWMGQTISREEMQLKIVWKRHAKVLPMSSDSTTCCGGRMNPTTRSIRPQRWHRLRIGSGSTA